MQTYEIVVRNRSVAANSDDMTLVRTSVGIDQVHVLFDSPEWLGFPVSITFAHGESIITQGLVLAEVDDSEWAAESFVAVPYEVIDMVGPIRVTFQGTDSEGRHIITAAGSPLSVEEAGDVIEGPAPSDVPTLDQWNQAYADAVAAANAAASLVQNLQGRIDSIVESAQNEIERMADSFIIPATSDALGVIRVGNRLSVDDDGVLSADYQASGGMTDSERLLLTNLGALASRCFDATFDGNGILADASLDESMVPLAKENVVGIVQPDLATTFVDDDGTIHAPGILHEWNDTVLVLTSQSGTTETDFSGLGMDIAEVAATVDETTGTPSVSVSVSGPSQAKVFSFAFSGLKGERGEQGIQGPSGYVLTSEDVASIADEILGRYDLFDAEEF